MITLGAEVAGVLQGVSGRRKRNALLGGDLKEIQLGAVGYPAIHLAHPGIVMRAASERNPWPRLHRERHIPEAREVVERLVLRR